MSAGFVVWLTGLSGAGKSTIARRLQDELAALGRAAELLDGDEVRTHLSKGLGFSKEDRDTNIRRIGYVARVLARNGGVAITAAISPYREVRDEVRAQTPGFVEVYVRCSLDELVRRDVKGLYRRALAGEIANFTGVSDPYEEPLDPDVVVDTELEDVDQSVAKIIAALEGLGHLPKRVVEVRRPSRYYPAFLDLAGRRCVVIGEGKIAAEKARDLEDCGAEVVSLPAYRAGLLRGAFLAIDASGDPGINRAVREEATRERALLNAVDVPPLCDFIAPAVVRRDPLQIAISTGGESPFLASALRARLERLFGSEWGPFTAQVGRVRRRLRAAGVALAEQTLIYRRLLRAQVVHDPAEPGGRVALVGAGPGDPGLLTLKAAALLAGSDYVLHDALVPPELLAYAGPQAELIDVGKRAGRARMSQAEINSLLIELARQGHDVVRLKGGDPFVFGRGGEELAALTGAGLEVTIVPGVSSAMAAPALAGIPLTLRGVAASVAFVSGHDPERLRRAALSADTLVVLMGLDRVEEIAASLAEVLGEDRPAAAVSAAGLPEQRAVRSTLGELAGAVRGQRLPAPATIIVGPVAALGGSTAGAALRPAVEATA